MYHENTKHKKAGMAIFMTDTRVQDEEDLPISNKSILQC